MPLAEPALFHLGFARRDRFGTSPTHALPVREVRAVAIGLPGVAARSEALRAVEAAGLVSIVADSPHLMTITFDGSTGERADLRPVLPLVLRW